MDSCPVFQVCNLHLSYDGLLSKSVRVELFIGFHEKAAMKNVYDVV